MAESQAEKHGNKILHRNVKVLEKIIIAGNNGDIVITIIDNPKRHVRVMIEGADSVRFLKTEDLRAA